MVSVKVSWVKYKWKKPKIHKRVGVCYNIYSMSTDMNDNECKTSKKNSKEYYVYRLVDPSTGHTFYVGKGKGNRVFQHVEEAKKLISADEDERSLKIQQINQITQIDKKEVIHIIHRWGMTESEALEVESALIDVYPGLSLTNIQSGHGADRGMISADKWREMQEIAIYEEPDVDYIIIKIREEILRNDDYDIYRTTRKAWNAKLSSASRYKYVFSVINGIVKEVFDVTRWYESAVYGERIEFEGKSCKEEWTKQVIGKKIPEKYRKRGLANPFLYKKSDKE